jgi:Flp pilus assembly protein TadD
VRRIACLLLLTFAISPATAAWREASSDHFVIYSEQSPKALEAFAADLERYDRGLRFVYGRAVDKPSASNRVTIFIVPSEQVVRRLLGAKRNSGIAGWYSGRAAGSVAFVPRSTEGEYLGFNAKLVLQHEYAHHFHLRYFTGAFPSWFTEGFAEFASTARVEKDKSILMGEAPQHRAFGLFAAGTMPIETLLTQSGFRDAAEADRFYGRAWLLNHYLTLEPSRRGQMLNYLVKINQGEDNLVAAKAAFGDLRQLDQDLNAYKLRSKLAVFRIAADKLTIGEIAVRELRPGESAMMDVKLVSKRGVDREQALALLPRARKTASPYPDDPAVQTALAEAEFDAGNYAEAAAAADRALRIDPKNGDALTYKGRAAMELATAGHDASAQVWSDVRKWFVAANRLEPDDPEALFLFYSSYLMQGIKPTGNAVDALLQAHYLAPQDEGLRLTVARRQLEDSKASEARFTLSPLAYNPHGGTLAEIAAQLIAALDRGGTTEALRLWSGNTQALSKIVGDDE